MKKIRILITDDHALFREGVRSVLAAEDDCQIVGEATNGLDAIALTERESPDLVLMDIRMPVLNGVDATSRIVTRWPNIGVVVLTMLEDDASVFAAMRAGARGYLLKGADKAEVLKTVRAVAAGEALFGPAIARRITYFFGGLAPASQVFPELTDREREVLSHIAQGSSNGEIAERLSVSLKTVSNHISSIFSKLQVADRAQAIVKAREAGLGGL